MYTLSPRKTRINSLKIRKIIRKKGIREDTEEEKIEDTKEFRYFNKDLRDRKRLEGIKILERLIELDYIKKALENYGNDVVLRLLEVMKWREFNDQDVILEYYDIANSCYLIFKGTVDVFVPSFVKEEGSTQKKLRLIYATSLHTGALFGEKGLIDNCKRSATIKSNKTTILLEVSKDNYLKIFEQFVRKELAIEVRFLKSIHIFRESVRSFIEKFYYILEKKTYTQGSIVVNQGDDLDFILILRTGSFAVIYKNKQKVKNTFNINIFNDFNRKKIESSQKEFKEINNRFTRVRNNELRDTYFKIEMNKLVILQPGDIFGDIETKNDHNKAYFTLKAINNNSCVYIITRKVFFITIRGS
jgi:CRP-like cAMP-binding protein